MKFLTGDNTVDISIVNAMMPKYKEKLETAQCRMEKAKAKMKKEKDAAQNATQEVTDLLSWAEAFDDAAIEEKHRIIARLVERIWLQGTDQVPHQRRAVHADRGIRVEKHELPRGDEPHGSFCRYATFLC